MNHTFSPPCTWTNHSRLNIRLSMSQLALRATGRLVCTSNLLHLFTCCHRAGALAPEYKKPRLSWNFFHFTLTPVSLPLSKSSHVLFEWPFLSIYIISSFPIMKHYITPVCLLVLAALVIAQKPKAVQAAPAAAVSLIWIFGGLASLKPKNFRSHI